jgi:isopenicillin-N epimerase
VATRAAAAAYAGGRPAEVALTDSTTMGLGLVYSGLRARPGQELLTTTSDYFVTHAAVATLAARTGARVVAIRAYEDVRTVSEDELVDTLLAAVGPRTRLVTTTWVHSSTGLKMPVRRVADRIAELNRDRRGLDRIVLGVDGAHGFGIEAEGVHELGCDFLMAGTHKWVFGPRGTGIVWGHPRAHGDVTPTIPSFTAAAGWGGTMSPGGFKAFEHQWALAEAFAVHRRLGKANVARRTHELARRLKEQLAEMPHVVLYTPLAERLSAGVVCFDVRGRRPREVVERLRERRIVASTTPYLPSYARFSPTVFNLPEEIDAAAAAVGELG